MHKAVHLFLEKMNKLQAATLRRTGLSLIKTIAVSDMEGGGHITLLAESVAVVIVEVIVACLKYFIVFSWSHNFSRLAAGSVRNVTPRLYAECKNPCYAALAWTKKKPQEVFNAPE